MRLLLYTHYFVPSVGGVENITLSLAKGITELPVEPGTAPHEVTVLTQTNADGFDDSPLPFRIVRKPGFWKVLSCCLQADVVHIAGPSLLPMFLTWLTRKPVVVEHHGYQGICPNGVLIQQPGGNICPGHFQARNYQECLRCTEKESPPPRNRVRLFFMKLRHQLAKRVSANIAITEYVNARHNLPRTQVIYYGIDDPLAGSSADAPENHPARPVFAFVGRFVPEKGIAILLRAAKQLVAEGYDFEVRLIGDGTLRPEVEQTIEREGLHNYVTITGFLRGPQIESALRGVAAVIMPSVWEEAAGLAAIEQMIRKRLVIASAVGGLSEVLGDAGLTFPCGDSTALAREMITVFRNPSLIRQYGEKGRARALRLFQRKRMILDHLKLYQALRTRQR